MDRELLSLGRAWCLYEVHVCLQHLQQSQLSVCLPGECIGCAPRLAVLCALGMSAL